VAAPGTTAWQNGASAVAHRPWCALGHRARPPNSAPAESLPLATAGSAGGVGGNGSPQLNRGNLPDGSRGQAGDPVCPDHRRGRLHRTLDSTTGCCASRARLTVTASCARTPRSSSTSPAPTRRDPDRAGRAVDGRSPSARASGPGRHWPRLGGRSGAGTRPDVRLAGRGERGPAGTSSGPHRDWLTAQVSSAQHDGRSRVVAAPAWAGGDPIATTTRAGRRETQPQAGPARRASAVVARLLAVRRTVPRSRRRTAPATTSRPAHDLPFNGQAPPQPPGNCPARSRGGRPVQPSPGPPATGSPPATGLEPCGCRSRPTSPPACRLMIRYFGSTEQCERDRVRTSGHSRATRIVRAGDHAVRNGTYRAKPATASCVLPRIRADVDSEKRETTWRRARLWISAPTSLNDNPLSCRTNSR